MTATNVLLVHCHDLGRFLGCYGVTSVATPNIDAFAASATLFEQAFATSPTCSPARSSLFTGLHPQRSGVLGLTHQPFGWDLRDPRAHLAHRFHRQGLRTELIGVHHESKVLPDRQVAERLGFDAVRSGGRRDDVVADALTTLDRFAAEARPFYLQVGFHEPHRTPSERDRPGVMGFLAPGVEPDDTRGVSVPTYLVDDDAAREELAELQGAVAYMDEGVGAILRRLQDLGLNESTVVVFTTDHGLPLPRAKGSLYDVGLGVALIVRAPDRPHWRSRRVSELVSHVDVVPMLFELLGLPAPTDVCGSSPVAVIDGEGPGRRQVYGQQTHHTYYDPKRSVRSATHKLIVNFANAPRAMDPTQSWVHRSRPCDMAAATVTTSEAFELYDLNADPDEMTNLAGPQLQVGPDVADTVAALAHSLVAWMARVDDPLLPPSHAHAPRHRAALEALVASAATHTPTEHPALNQAITERESE